MGNEITISTLLRFLYILSLTSSIQVLSQTQKTAIHTQTFEMGAEQGRPQIASRFFVSDNLQSFYEWFALRAKNEVKRNFRDPESTRFRNIHIAGSDSVGSVCGEVNTKNGFGGYVGYRRFIFSHYSDLKKYYPPLLESSNRSDSHHKSEDPHFEAVWKMNCLDYKILWRED